MNELELAIALLLGEATVKKGEKEPEIKSVTFNKSKGVTTVVLKDGRKGIAKVANNDVYDEKVGMALAYCYALFGSKNKFNKKVDELNSNKK